MRLQGFARGDARRAFAINGIEEIRPDAAMESMAEGHGIGAGAAGKIVGRQIFAPPVLPAQHQAGARQRRRALCADDLDPLQAAGIGAGGGVYRADGAILEAQHRAGNVFGFHAVTGAVAREACDPRHRAGQTAHQVDGVDRLAEQHAAAVASFGAASRHVVIALRPPQRHADGNADHRSQPTLCQHRRETQRRRFEAVLQHHRRRHARALDDKDQPLAALGGDLERLFQQDVLAGGAGALHQLEMAGRWRENGDGINGGIGEDRIEIATHLQAGGRRKGFTPRGTRRERSRHLRPAGQVFQALDMRPSGQAEPDQGDAMHGLEVK